MQRYHNALEKYFKPKFFYGIKTYVRNQYRKPRIEEEVVTFKEISETNLGVDVIDIILKYAYEMRDEKIDEEIKKIKKDFQLTIKYKLLYECFKFPDDILNKNWYMTFDEVKENIIKEKEGIVSENILQVILCAEIIEITMDMLKACFIHSIGGHRNLIPKFISRGCKCGCRTYNKFLTDNEKPPIIFQDQTNYFDELFKENNMNKLFKTHLDYVDLIMKTFYKTTGDDKFPRKNYTKKFNYKAFYTKLVKQY